jgi:hypothetical protein
MNKIKFAGFYLLIKNKSEHTLLRDSSILILKKRKPNFTRFADILKTKSNIQLQKVLRYFNHFPSVSKERSVSIFTINKQEKHTDGSDRSFFLAGCLLSLLFDTENRDSMFLRNVAKHLPDYNIVTS